MERLAVAYPGKQVHVVWDNLNTHRAQAVSQAFNARHGKRFHFHFTPLHARVESIRSNSGLRVIPAGCCAKPVTPSGSSASPFKWSFRGYPLQGGAS
ncbi:transposase [Paraburkholderia terrae]|uniref:Tc1-like transposase DDE domain-containing protein n=1 Tax=Paraburkholderia terrae TaxID=311230 RepID=A0ABM7U1J8_9BURK|nr:transposase [Paraburkholderia terrae]BCZ85000.1 hypothetical protein PTKU64_86750 [Paraburkholderia terrae]BDC44962.1 hypothetical protein PTKU15_82590 [Paraburkholderia terrae]